MGQFSSLLVLILGAVFLTIGDIFFKIWLVQKTGYIYIGGFLSYAAGLVCLIESFKTTNIAASSAILVVSNLIILGLVSWLYFREPLSIPQIFGMLLAVIAIVLLERY